MKRYVIQWKPNPKFTLNENPDWQFGPSYKRLDRAIARFPCVSPFREYRLVDTQTNVIIRIQPLMK